MLLRKISSWRIRLIVDARNRNKITYRSKQSVVVFLKTSVTAVTEVYPAQEQGQEDKGKTAFD
jgi:hypothetical protein